MGINEEGCSGGDGMWRRVQYSIVLSREDQTGEGVVHGDVAQRETSLMCLRYCAMVL